MDTVSISISIRPDSIFERSSRSLTRSRSRSTSSAAASSNSRSRSSSTSPCRSRNRRTLMPMLVSGVLSSWEAVATNSDFRRFSSCNSVITQLGAGTDEVEKAVEFGNAGGHRLTTVAARCDPSCRQSGRRPSRAEGQHHPPERRRGDGLLAAGHHGHPHAQLRGRLMRPARTALLRPGRLN